MMISSVLLAAATLAAAAEPPKSDFPASEVRRLVHEYGRCIVKRHPERASEAILSNVAGATFARDYSRLIDGACMPRQGRAGLQARFQGDQFRYALADALVQRELAGLPAPVLEPVPLLDHRDPGEPPSRLDSKGRPLSAAKYQAALEGYDRAKGFTYLSRYGECVVRMDTAASRALLLTEPASPQEGEQFTALNRALGTCLPEGATMRFGRLALRGTIAINYYRLATAARHGRLQEAAK